MPRVPLVDLKTQHSELRDELLSVFNRTLEEGSFIGGPDHRAFESEFAEFCGGGHVALCANGTDALSLAIVATCGQGSGDGEIITVSHSFIATSEAITFAGYKPVFIDVDPKHYVMDPEKLKAAITSKTKAIIPVHVYGQMAPTKEICEIAQKNNL